MLKDEAHWGLTILESSVYRTPMPGPTGALGPPKHIPPPGVCAHLLRKAVQVRPGCQGCEALNMGTPSTAFAEGLHTAPPGRLVGPAFAADCYQCLMPSCLTQPQRQPRELRSWSDSAFFTRMQGDLCCESPPPQDPSLAEKAAEVAEQLMLQGTRLEAPTLKVRPA